MSTITNINSTSAAYVPPAPAETPPISSANFSQALAVAQSPKTLLTTAEASSASRPNVKEFMDRTGAQFLDASELIYGVVGSNTDVRDWTSIMASKDPITAARQATGQMYGRTDITPRVDATYMGQGDTVAKEGNFAVRLLKDKDQNVVDQGLKLIDAQGLLLRDAGNNPETIARNAWLFGFDTQPLAKLGQAADTISEGLGKAIEQAKIMVPSASTPVEAITQPPVLTTAEKTESLTAPAVIVQTSATTNKEPVVKQIDDVQASAPTLEQTIAEAAANAFSYVDSSTYLNSLFNKT